MSGPAFEKRPEPPWQGARGLQAILERWRGEPGVWRSIVLEHQVEPKSSSTQPLPGKLAPDLADALRRRGIDRLYAHQAQAFDLALTGKDVVIATPTASGKSLCYNLPILDHLSREPDARALYLFSNQGAFP